MTDNDKPSAAMPTLEDWQHWTLVMGRAQQMMMEAWAAGLARTKKLALRSAWSPAALLWRAEGRVGERRPSIGGRPMALMTAGRRPGHGLETWGKMLGGAVNGADVSQVRVGDSPRPKARHPIVDTIRQTICDVRPDAAAVEEFEGLDADARHKCVRDQELVAAMARQTVR